MDWLHSLGLLQADFSTPQLSLTHNGSPITLHGTTKPSPNHVSYTHIFHLLHIDVIASLYLLIFQHIPLPTPSSPKMSIPIFQHFLNHTTHFSPLSWTIT